MFFIDVKTLLISLIMVSGVVQADVPVSQVEEVEHLLNFVKNSDCIINRNGTGHLAAEGVDHIRNKYDYFRDDINNTEEFIEYAASKSTMSGKDYTVECPEKEIMKTQNWLLDELKQFRSR